MSDYKTIGEICNSYGRLSVKTEEEKFFWSIESWDGDHWEEIPKSLYEELIRFEDGEQP